MNMEAAMQTFLEEAHELLADMERILLDVESADTSAEQLNALFRAMHTIKGSAGLFGLDEIVRFTHEAEEVLDHLRCGKLTLDDALSGLLLRCHDHVKAMLTVINDKQAMVAMLETPLLVELGAVIGHDKLAASPTDQPVLAESCASFPQAEGCDDETVWGLSLRFGADVLRNGMDPGSFLRYLAFQGEIRQIVPVLARLQAASDFDPETNYLRFELIYVFNGGIQVLQDVFEFVRDDSHIVIFPLAEFDHYLPQILAGSEAGEQQEVLDAWRQLGMLAALPQDDVPLSPVIVPESHPAVTASPVVTGNADKSVSRNDGKSSKAVESKFIKVEAGKLDSLINLIGELVIAGAAANLLAKRSGRGDLVESTMAIASLIEQIRAGTLSMRMVQIGDIFNRFPRVVRDVSRELGKNIELHLSGADTELDKSMVDKLADPLMHIVRNAIDHGIESTDKRLAAGKTEVGHLWMNAYHESGSVVIEVADDGAGLNRERIMAKAIANGLVAAEVTLSDAEIYKLIFEPGFSTAEQVTSISGRGVGMDVVRRAIEQLRGSIEIDAEPGEGTTFRIHLPLTLAIIDGFQVGVGNATFVIPLETVIECIELPEEHTLGGAHNCLNLRGEVLPLLGLNEFLELGYPRGKRQNVVVVRYAESKAGLVVDELMGEFQTVIKPMGALFRNLRAISGSTILGSGEVALILDVPALISHAVLRENELLQPPQIKAVFKS